MRNKCSLNKGKDTEEEKYFKNNFFERDMLDCKQLEEKKLMIYVPGDTYIKPASTNFVRLVISNTKDDKFSEKGCSSDVSEWWDKGCACALTCQLEE